MSIHIGAEPGQIAPTVLLPGDPLRARSGSPRPSSTTPTCYSEVRGMYGFTGTWQGKPVSVQGSGMGQPSMSIYVNELFREYDVQRIIRVGSCGAVSEQVAIRDVVIASGACTDSSMNRLRFHGLDYAPVADFGLLRAAVDAAEARDDVTSHVGLIFSGDTFYNPREELMAPMVAHGVLAVEMEASALYTLAASYGRKALAICTVSDHIVTGEETTSAEREQTFGAMVDIALVSGGRCGLTGSVGAGSRRGGDDELGPLVGLWEGTCGPLSTLGIRTAVTASWRTTHRSPLLSRIATPWPSLLMIAAGDPVTRDVEPDDHALVLGAVERVPHRQQHGGSEHLGPLEIWIRDESANRPDIRALKGDQSGSTGLDRAGAVQQFLEGSAVGKVRRQHRLPACARSGSRPTTWSSGTPSSSAQASR